MHSEAIPTDCFHCRIELDLLLVLTIDSAFHPSRLYVQRPD